MESYWNILDIEPTSNQKDIKKAYAKLLKKNSPEKNPEGFQILRQAYEFALQTSQQIDDLTTDQNIDIKDDKDNLDENTSSNTNEISKSEPSNMFKEPEKQELRLNERIKEDILNSTFDFDIESQSYPDNGDINQDPFNAAVNYVHELMTLLIQNRESDAIEYFRAITNPRSFTGIKTMEHIESLLYSKIKDWRHPYVPHRIFEIIRSYFGWQKIEEQKIKANPAPNPPPSNNISCGGRIIAIAVVFIGVKLFAGLIGYFTYQQSTRINSEQISQTAKKTSVYYQQDKIGNGLTTKNKTVRPEVDNDTNSKIYGYKISLGGNSIDGLSFRLLELKLAPAISYHSENIYRTVCYTDQISDLLISKIDQFTRYRIQKFRSKKDHPCTTIDKKISNNIGLDFNLNKGRILKLLGTPNANNEEVFEYTSKHSNFRTRLRIFFQKGSISHIDFEKNKTD